MGLNIESVRRRHEGETHRPQQASIGNGGLIGGDMRFRIVLERQFHRDLSLHDSPIFGEYLGIECVYFGDWRIELEVSRPRHKKACLSG
jgi:hypothetical protein